MTPEDSDTDKCRKRRPRDPDRPPPALLRSLPIHFLSDSAGDGNDDDDDNGDAGEEDVCYRRLLFSCC